jgi:2-dehydro-3-deoxyphosphogluconate aldolase/(4S)-4-hydroxy-2-oxoglutarate aldolase
MENQLRKLGVVPVVAIENAAHALPLADALIRGGLPVAEITFRTAAGAEVMQRIAAERPQVLVGAGTVLTVQQVKLAKSSGARFAVAPGFNPDVVKAAQDLELPFFPGIMTPSDIEGALSLGCRMLKFFPAGPAGGAKMLQAISAPYAHLGVRFMPTGGVTLDNLGDYLAMSSVPAAGGTWIATTDAIRNEDWKGIEAKAAAASAKVKELRASASE